MAIPSHTEDLNELMRRRREELDELRKRGVDPYPYSYERTATASDILVTFKDGGPQLEVSVAGRIMSIRRMGKASFAHIQDSTGKIQVYLKKDDLGDVYDAFRLMDIGDIIGVKGY
ncbi:MAG: OB-fold nucleic acid binding domain-containing protein, partial [Bacteroidota bacterium]